MCWQPNHYWFRLWLVAWSAPSHYLDQYRNNVNWTLRNKLKWNFNQNFNYSIKYIWNCHLRNGSHFVSASMFWPLHCPPQILSEASQIAKFMGPTRGPSWVLPAPDGPHVGPMNLAIRDGILYHSWVQMPCCHSMTSHLWTQSCLM